MNIKKIIREELDGYLDSTEEDFEWAEDTEPSFSDELLYLLKPSFKYSFLLSNNSGYLLRLYYGLRQEHFITTLYLLDDTMGSLKSALRNKIRYFHSDIEFEKRMEMPDLDELSEKAVMLEEILDLLNEH